MFVERTIRTEGYTICFVQSLKIDFFLQQKKATLVSYTQLYNFPVNVQKGEKRNKFQKPFKRD